MIGLRRLESREALLPPDVKAIFRECEIAASRLPRNEFMLTGTVASYLHDWVGRWLFHQMTGSRMVAARHAYNFYALLSKEEQRFFVARLFYHAFMAQLADPELQPRSNFGMM